MSALSQSIIRASHGVYRALHAGAPSAPGLLFLHGFLGSADDFAGVFAALSPNWRCVAVDLPGHGKTVMSSSEWTGDEALDDLAQICAELGITAGVVGYSLGGRTALSLTLRHPAAVPRLLLESASPGLQTETERAQRRQADAALAQLALRSGMETFVAAWEDLPLFASQKSLPQSARLRQRAIRLAQQPSGIAQSLDRMGTGAQPDHWPDLERITQPVHLLVGELDEKFVGIGRSMVQRLPSATLTVAQGAGHNVHLECPERYVRFVADAVAGEFSSSGK